MRVEVRESTREVRIRQTVVGAVASAGPRRTSEIVVTLEGPERSVAGSVDVMTSAAARAARIGSSDRYEVTLTSGYNELVLVQLSLDSRRRAYRRTYISNPSNKVFMSYRRVR